MTARADALKAGLLTYEGRPCYRCGATTKYTRQGACVACNRDHSRITAAKRRAAEKAKRGA